MELPSRNSNPLRTALLGFALLAPVCAIAPAFLHPPLLAALAPIRVSRLQGPDVFTVAPVYGHIGSKAGFVSAINVHLALSSFGQALWSRERLIVESWLFPDSI